jgi:hypothetical protein
MAGKFDLENYETVELRLRRLYTEYPAARVLTDLVFHDERRFIVKAEVYLTIDDLSPVATGYAEEIVGASPVNRTSALENCETSAVGRAISNSVLCLKAPEGKRPSQQEMEKVQRYEKEPRKTVKAAREYTPEEIAKAKFVLEHEVPILAWVDEARRCWEANKDLLDAPVDGTTLKDALNAKVVSLQQ